MSELKDQYQELKRRNLSIDMSRGRPAPDQLDLSNEILTLDIPTRGKDCPDIRNYGMLAGIVEARELFGELLCEPAENVLVLGNSSLKIMYDTIANAWTFGICGGTPWGKLDHVKFLCPSPGYDRHFSITEHFGCELVLVPMKEDGPDMDVVEELVAGDDSIKGMWVVPQYSNPTGITFSDEVVRRMATMKVAAQDFRIFWDNAYCVHHLYDEFEEVADLGKACVEAGNPDRYYKFASLSKVTFAGAGIAAMAASKANIDSAKVCLSYSMIASDKVSQMKQVTFLPNKAAVLEHMKKHAAILRPKFEMVDKKLSEGLAGVDYVSWTHPKGGYFVSYNCKPGTAKRVVQIASELGVKFTGAGSAFPYGKDPNDENIRIAPSCPSVEELEVAMDVLVLATKLAAEE